MGSIYLIRHGQASFGAENYDVLSPVGIRQSQVLGAYLAELGLSFDRCVSGELMRQKDTAQHVLGQYTEAGLDTPDVQLDSAFDEFDAEGVIRALIPAMLEEEPQALDILRDAAANPAGFQRLFNLITRRWLSGNHDTPGLQSWQAFVTRVEAGLKRILRLPARMSVSRYSPPAAPLPPCCILLPECLHQRRWSFTGTSSTRRCTSLNSKATT